MVATREPKGLRGIHLGVLVMLLAVSLGAQEAGTVPEAGSFRESLMASLSIDVGRKF